MPFVDLLKTTVLLSAGAATLLAVLTLLGAGTQNDSGVALQGIAWWAIATVIGFVLGRRTDAYPAIARVLAAAKASSTIPEQRPASVLLNRLWPLLLSTIAAGALTIVAPQIPAIFAGGAIIWALYWRHQHSAVTAIERRDGVRFYVDRTSPVAPIALTRTPGFKAYLPANQVSNAA
jgi:hypothetical protein